MGKFSYGNTSLELRLESHLDSSNQLEHLIAFYALTKGPNSKEYGHALVILGQPSFSDCSDCSALYDVFLEVNKRDKLLPDQALTQLLKWWKERWNVACKRITLNLATHDKFLQDCEDRRIDAIMPKPREEDGAIN